MKRTRFFALLDLDRDALEKVASVCLQLFIVLRDSLRLGALQLKKVEHGLPVGQILLLHHTPEDETVTQSEAADVLAELHAA